MRGDVHVLPPWSGHRPLPGRVLPVHSLQDADFERKDAAGATAFGQAAALQGLGRIIYLGGLGNDADTLSAHLPQAPP